MGEILKKAGHFFLGYHGINIHQRLMRLVLFAILSFFAAIALFFMVGENFFRQDISRIDSEFARANSEYTKEVIEKTSMATLAKLAVADAWSINRELDLMRHDADVLANAMTLIMTHPENYHPHSVRDPHEGKVPPGEPFILYSPALRHQGIGALRDEVALAANIKGILFSTEMSQGDSYAACYIGSQNGFLICSSVFPRDEYSPISNDADYEYDPRTRPWYINAATSGKTVFSGPYLTILTKEHTDVEVISCSTPYYDENGIAGVASVDLATDGIRRFVSEASESDGEIRFVADAGGNIIFSSVREGTLARTESPKDIRKSGDHLFNEAAHAMTGGKSGIQLVELDGTRYYLAFAPVPAVDWSYGIMVLEENISPSLAESQEFYRAMEENFHNSFQDAYNSLLQGAILVAVLLIVLFFFLSKSLSGRFVRPILALTDGVREIAKGDFDKKLDIKTGDEIEELADSFNAMTEELKRYIQNMAQAAAEKERARTEMEVAARIQLDMLPDGHEPFPERKEFDIYASMDPARDVGGDFYDFYLPDEGHLVITIADVSGKGVPAALFMAKSQSVLKNCVMKAKGNELALALAEANRQLCRNNEAAMFVTVFLGMLDLATGRLDYVNGGHCPPLLGTVGGYDFLPMKRSMVLGLMDFPYEQQHVMLTPGDTLLLYTDGVSEAMDEAGSLFKESRIKEELNVLPPDQKVEDVLSKLLEKVRQHAGGAEQSDDITMLGLRYNGKE